MEDVDPDLNFYNNIAFNDTMYKLPSEIQDSVDDSTHFEFSILHANCRGLVYNFDKLQSLVDTIPTNISVIATTETWTESHNEKNCQLDGYNFEVISRRHKSCGGVGLYVNHSLRYTLRNDLCVSVPDTLECVFIELELTKMLVGCLYRPPGSDVASFTAQLDTLLSRINNEKKIAYIAGDFNINLLKYDSHVPTSEYVNCVFSHYFYPTINRPTRITEMSATLIDNIITNDVN